MAQLTGKDLQGCGNLIVCPDGEGKVLHAPVNMQRAQNGHMSLSQCSVRQLNELQESVAMDMLGEQDRKQC